MYQDIGIPRLKMDLSTLSILFSPVQSIGTSMIKAIFCTSCNVPTSVNFLLKVIVMVPTTHDSPPFACALMNYLCHMRAGLPFFLEFGTSHQCLGRNLGPTNPFDGKRHRQSNVTPNAAILQPFSSSLSSLYMTSLKLFNLNHRKRNN